jgi:hypothetical protein
VSAPLPRLHWLKLAAALLLLNASMTFGNVWPTPAIRWRWALSLELATLVAAMAIAAGRLSARWRTALAIAWVGLVVGHYADVTAFGLYGRDVNLYWDARHLGNVASMLTGTIPPGVLLGWTAAAVLVAAASVLVAWWAITEVAGAARWQRPRWLLTALAATVVFAWVVAGVTHDPADTDDRDDLFATPVMPLVVGQARLLFDRLGQGDTVRVAESPALDVPVTLGGADVVLAFVESYGAVTYDRPAVADAAAPARDALLASARATGRNIVSAFVESPTFGGSSWLAHLSLLSGVEVRDGYAYAFLMSQPRDTLVTTFSSAGYRTVGVMPGMRQAWPEGAFYGYDRILDFDTLDWRGPRFGWWTIPDQFALARLDALERPAGGRAPVFAVFPTGTSHAPFGPVPPYQADWAHVLSDEPFTSAAVDEALARPPDLTDLGPAYTRAITYTLRSLAGYMWANADRELVLLVVGDHQPPAAVSGAGVSWDVPVHVVARPGPFLDTLVARGFTDGVAPPRTPLGPMAGLLPVLLEALGAAPAGTPGGE